MRELLLGCDVGTSSAKVTVIDFAGQVVATAACEYGLHVRAEGVVEQDPLVVLRAATGAIKAAVRPGSGVASSIVGAAFSGQAPSCIALDGETRPLRPMMLYSDRRGQAEAAELRDSIGAEALFALTGNYVDPYYASVKILWIKENEPETYARTRVFLGIKDFIVANLTGWIGTDHSHAALYGVAFDIRGRRWQGALLEDLGLSPEKYPQPVSCTTPIARINGEGARATGLREGTPVIAGTVDVCASMLTAGVIRPGDSAVTLGTSSDWALQCQGDNFVPRTISLPSAGASLREHLILATVPCAGGMLRWLKETLIQREFPCGYDELDRIAANVPPGARGLVMLPHALGGETPTWSQIPQAGLFGLRLDHGPAELARAVMEGVAYALRSNQQWMSDHLVPFPQRIGIVGGGARSSPWCQILCDVLGVEGYVVANACEPAIGDAVVAGVGLGVFEGTDVLSEWIASVPFRTHRPDPMRHAAYSRLYRVFRGLQDATLDAATTLVECGRQA
jgi:xylulokinase